MPLRLLSTNAMSGAPCRWFLILVLAALPLVAGCPTEVPYQAPEDESEAPALVSDEPETAQNESGDLAEADPSAETTPSDTPEANDSPAPASGDRYGIQAGQAPARMPWETAEPSDSATPEAERLFAAAETPVETTPEAEEPAEQEPAESGDGFGDFLGDAYADLLDEEPPKEPQPEQPDPEPAEPEPSAVAATPAPDLGSRYEVDDLFPAEPAVEDAVVVSPAPEEPAETIELEDPVQLDDLWAEEADAAEPATDPIPDPEPPLPAEADPDLEETLPFGPAEAPPLFADVFEPAQSEPAPPETVETVIEQPDPETPEPIETLPEPPTPDPEPALAAEPEPVFESRPPRETPMASSAIDPLPAVPVLPFNTRHLAWLLGAKYGLAELADLDGATPDEVAEWSTEVDRLARELRLDPPPRNRESDEPAERVGRMMRAAARLGEALASEHGADHAALLEISLKTNALLVVAENRPDLAGPVARAVRDAADRALLPRFLWDQTVRRLENDPTPDETLDAVNGLHERVESFLR